MSGKDKVEAAAKAAEDTSFLDADAGMGYDGMTADQFAPLFLSILHSSAPQIQEGMDGYVPGAKFGDFYLANNNKVYGKTIEVVPLKAEEVWLEWRPNNGGLAGRHAVGPQYGYGSGPEHCFGGRRLLSLLGLASRQL